MPGSPEEVQKRGPGSQRRPKNEPQNLEEVQKQASVRKPEEIQEPAEPRRSKNEAPARGGPKTNHKNKPRENINRTRKTKRVQKQDKTAAEDKGSKTGLRKIKRIKKQACGR